MHFSSPCEHLRRVPAGCFRSTVAKVRHAVHSTRLRGRSLAERSPGRTGAVLHPRCRLTRPKWKCKLESLAGRRRRTPGMEDGVDLSARTWHGAVLSSTCERRHGWSSPPTVDSRQSTSAALAPGLSYSALKPLGIPRRVILLYCCVYSPARNPAASPPSRQMRPCPIRPKVDSRKEPDGILVHTPIVHTSGF